MGAPPAPGGQSLRHSRDFPHACWSLPDCSFRPAPSQADWCPGVCCVPSDRGAQRQTQSSPGSNWDKLPGHKEGRRCWPLESLAFYVISSVRLFYSKSKKTFFLRVFLLFVFLFLFFVSIKDPSGITCIQNHLVFSV